MPRRVAVTVEQCWHRVPGGTAVATVGLLGGLARRDDVDAVGVAAQHCDPPPGPARPPVPVAHHGLPRLALYEAWHRARRPRVQQACGPVDVVHATSLAVPPRSAPLVVTVHDVAFLHYPEHFTPRGLRLFHRGLDLAVREADRVVCPSQAAADDAAHAGVPAERLRVVPNGVDPVPVPDAATRDRARARLAAGRLGLDGPFVLWVGTVEPRKNLPNLLAAWGTLAPAGVNLVLAGPPGWGVALDRLVRHVEGVVVAGFAAPAELDDLYAAAEAVCYPSLLEGFGLPVLEALARGVPVVTSAGGATAEVAGDAAVLVDPGDPAAIAEGLDAVLSDPALAARLRAAGPVRAAGFTWDAAAAAAAAVYAEVCP